jgi:hypothetical protein
MTGFVHQPDAKRRFQAPAAIAPHRPHTAISVRGASQTGLRPANGRDRSRVRQHSTRNRPAVFFLPSAHGLTMPRFMTYRKSKPA